MASKVDLGDYEGRPVIMASIVIPNAGGGLHDSLALDPVVLHTGDEFVIALRCRCENIIHEVVKHKGEDTGNYNRVHKAVAIMGQIIDADLVAKLFAEQRKRIDEAKGVQSIPGIDD